MKYLLRTIFIAFLIFGFYSESLSQATGLELFREMSNPDFTTAEGTERLSWLPDGLGYLETEETEDGSNRFYKVDPENEERSPLFEGDTKEALLDQFNNMENDTLSEFPFDEFDFVMENSAIFFTVDETDYLFNLDDENLRKLYKPEIERQPYTEELMRNMEESQLWNGTYSDDYTQFAYVKDFDIYVVDTETKEEKRLTEGNEEQMNGRPSWVYPEEFGQRDNYWFSPDGSKIAYLQYNETDVFEYPIIHELDFEAGLELERYPKAGETNPTVKLFIVDIESGDIQQVPTNSGPDTYIIRPVWRNDGSELTFRRMNRQQNELELLAYNLEEQSLRTILEEEEDAYISLHDNFIQLEDGEHFVWTSETSGYNHIYLYNFDGSLVNAITEGSKPVGQIELVDQENETVYYTAYENMGLDQHLYSVDFDGSDRTKLTEESGRHIINMDDRGQYYTDRFSSFNHPQTTKLHNSSGEEVRTLSSTDTSSIEEHELQKPEYFEFKADDGSTLPGLVYKPTNFDPEKSYPILLPLYGGPETQDVTNTYKTADTYQQMAQLGFLVVRANFRGSGNRGKEFATKHYQQLGTLEMDDYAKAIQTIADREYADGNRVGVYGHSYGGYATLMLMLKYPDLFHVGVSGAPVTDWRSYDTIYTERYMRTPQENQEGYNEGSALKYADQLAGELLIVHGTTDNNVHQGNTIQMINEFIKADKDFDLVLYPEQRHGISGEHGAHYQKKRMNHLVRHLEPETKEDFLQLNSWSN